MDEKQLPDDWGYCRMCRYRICSSVGFFGKELHGANYCYSCYPKAVDIYLAEQRLLKFDREG